MGVTKKDATESGVEQQILLMRAFTERTGALHEGQVLQLKLWPRVVFAKSLSSQARVSVEKKEVSFDILVDKGSRNEARVPEADQPKTLDEWTKTLLGPLWSVSIYVSERGKRKREKFHFPAQEKKDDKPKE